MDLVSSIRKSGSRGGVNFNWEDVASSAHRENYLGHSLKAPVGRWQKGRDLSWYAKNEEGSSGPSDETEEERAARLRQDELKRVKEAEEDAMARVLGLPPPVRNQTGANAVEVDKPRIGPQSGPDADADAKKQHRHEDPERRHRRRPRSRSRDRDGERRRDRSPRRREDYESRRAGDDRHDRERRREHGREQDVDRPSRRHRGDDNRRHDRRRRSYSRDRKDDRPHRSHRRDRSRSPRAEAPAMVERQRPRLRDRRRSRSPGDRSP